MPPINPVKDSCTLLGPQFLHVSDPYEGKNPLLYEKPGDLSEDQLYEIVFNTYPFCSAASLRRLLPELLPRWAVALHSSVGENTPHAFCTTAESLVDQMYDFLYTTQLLKENCPTEIQITVSRYMVATIMELVDQWAEPLRDNFTVGGDNRFIRHFNSCAAVFPTVAPLWEAWWKMHSVGAILNAAWFLFTIRGESLLPDGGIVDCGDLSFHNVSLATQRIRFWDEESERYLLQDVLWQKCIDDLVYNIINTPKIASLSQQTIMVKCAVCMNPDAIVFRSRFETYVKRMSRNQSQWQFWSDVEPFSN